MTVLFTSCNFRFLLFLNLCTAAHGNERSAFFLHILPRNGHHTDVVIFRDLIPEFLGRLPIMFTLEALTEDMLVRILKEPKNAILKQYQKLLAMDEVRLEFEDDALMAIAKQAKEKKVGARALQIGRASCRERV